MSHPKRNLVGVLGLLLCPFFISDIFSQGNLQPSANDTLVNYCRLIRAGLFYGSLESEYQGSIPVSDVNHFNGIWKTVYSHSRYQKGVTQNEFTGTLRFAFGNREPFPSTAKYHSMQPDGYILFHLTREAGRVQSPKHASCNTCVQTSIDQINALLKGTQLHRQLSDIWVGPGIFKKLTSTNDVKELEFFLKCMFYDDNLHPGSQPVGYDLPPLVECPDTTIIECKDEIKPEVTVAWRHCGLGGKTDTIGPILIKGIDNCPGAVYSYTFIAKDQCLKTDSAKQFFRIENTPPEITCPPDTVVTCIDALQSRIPGYQSSCKVSVRDSLYGPSLISGTNNCPDAIYEMEYLIIDTCGRFASCLQTVRINNDPPKITCPPDQIVKCPAEVKSSAPAIEVSCNLDHNIEISKPKLIKGQGMCPGDEYEIRYKVTDKCGRSNSCIQKFTIDNRGPVIQCPPDEVVLCFDEINIGVPPVMEAACGEIPNLDISGPILVSGTMNCIPSEYEVTYTVTDVCGRTASCVQTFSIIDGVLDVKCPPDREVECADEIEAGSPEVDLICPVPYDTKHTGPELVSGEENCPGAVYEIRYTITDACGREEKCTQTFTIENDPPEIECPPDENIECIEDIELDSAQFEVACDLGYVLVWGNPTLISGQENCPDAVYEVKHMLEDACGRKVECVQTITISNPDPEIDCPPDSVVTCAEDIVATEPAYRVSCQLGHTLGRDIQPQLVSGTPNCPGAVYTINHTIHDDCGRSASCDQYFTIDNAPPAMDCPPDRTVPCEADISLENPNYTSDCDSVLISFTGPDLESGTRNCPGAVYVVIYNLTDQCGRSVECEQRFTLTGELMDIICPPDTTIRVFDRIVTRPPLVSAACGVDYDNISSTPRLISGTDGLPGAVYEVEHVVTDECQNQAFCIQRITLIGLPDDGQISLCDCSKAYLLVSLDLVEDRQQKFMNDVAELVKLYGCKKLTEWAKSNISELWQSWSSSTVIGADAGYASLLKNRGAIDVVMENMGYIEKVIEVLEEGVRGDPKKAIEIFSEFLTLELANHMAGTGTPALVFSAVKSLGQFGAYLNAEIMISNIKTLAEIADRDPAIFDPDHYLLEYARIREIKPEDRVDWNDVFNKYRITIWEYSQTRLNNPNLPPAWEIWQDQRKMNTVRATTMAMLTEVCQYWCYKKQLVDNLNTLRQEQNVLKRFKATWEHFKNTECSGDVVCNVPNAEIRTINGVDTCACKSGYKFDPAGLRCIEFEDCIQNPNTIEVYRGDRYICECEPGFELAPNGTDCVPTVECDPALNQQKIFVNNAWQCDCMPGFKWDPGYTKCVPYDDCGNAGNVTLQYDNDRYICVCETGHRWNPGRTNCIPAEDCSGIPNAVSVFRTDRYECACDFGYKWDPSMTKCVPYEDCTQKPNTRQVYQNDAYICECLPGYQMKADGSGCESVLDCSAYPNSVPVWNASINDYECDCKQGYEWNDSYTACVQILDCSNFPNSVPVWNAAINDYECDCEQGFEWNDSYTACIESVPDCESFYPNTMAVFNSSTQQYECDCLPGFEWNANQTGCREIQVLTCDIPHTVLQYDSFNDEYYCECETGYRWNGSRTACIKRADPSETIGTITDILTTIAGSTGNTGPGSANPTVRPEQQKTGECNVTYRSGANEPEQYTIDVFQTFGTVIFEYQTYTVKDRVHVYQGAFKVFDSGCVGTQGWQSTSINIQGNSVFRIVIDPLCDPNETNTRWDFKLGCP